MKKRKIIDISTEEKRGEVFEKFNSFTSKSQAHEYFGISDNTQGCNYIKEIAESIGFDLNVYKERKQKPIRYCKQCGKEITSRHAKKFCCLSCATKYNNEHRDKSIYEKIAKRLRKDNSTSKRNKAHILAERFCVVCGKKLEGLHFKYCSESCKSIGSYASKEEHDKVCQECGKPFRSKTVKTKFCSSKCASEYHKKIKVNEWLDGVLKINPNRKLPKSIRDYLLKIHDNKCEICGFEGYNKATNNSILQIHHIDGNCGNNSPENIQLICPNCHAMTENFMALNRGNSARDERYKNKKDS